MKKPKREKFYTKQALADEFCMSDAMIRRYLPEPVLTKNPRYKHARPIKLWTVSQVNTALENPELRAAVRRAKLKREREKKKADSIRSYLLSFDIENLRQRAMTLERSFILHIGPTNSGKTHDALAALRAAESGQYLGPLRLLALEMFDRLNADGCPCNLLTGEESIETDGAFHTASTIELCDYDSSYDTAVIDEAQMITDPFRGDRWVKAIYCADAKTIHICLAPEAESLIIEILESFHAPYEIVRHERLAPLRYAGAFRSIRDTQPGDALIVFSRRAVLAVSAELEHRGIRSSVIYGALPPASRREEVRRFTQKETEAVVATDAIGMGVSLPIRRIIFCEIMKYDGKHTRKLESQEIKQIAGRAGRFGIYDEGEVLTMAEGKLVEDALSVPEPQAKKLTLPFPDEAVDSEYPLDELMAEWDRLPVSPGFVRADMSESIELYKHLKPIVKKLEREMVFKLITCPLDIKDEDAVNYWLQCCFSIQQNIVLPEPFSGTDTLEECEKRYRQLDVRHQLLRRIGIEEDRMEEKMELSRRINEFLEKDKDRYLKHCSRCGKVLPATSSYGICDRCYRRGFGGSVFYR